MPDYVVTGPDGKEYEVNAPQGSSQTSIIRQVQSYIDANAAPVEVEEEESPGFLRRTGDVATSVVTGIPKALGALTSLGSSVPYLNVVADPIAQGLFDIGEYGDEALLSDFQQQQNDELGARIQEAASQLDQISEDAPLSEKAKFVYDTMIAQGGEAAEYISENPSQVFNLIGQTLPHIFLGGAVGKGLKTAGAVKNAGVAGAIGEGVIAGGDSVGGIVRDQRAEGDFEYDPSRLYGLAAGATTGLISRGGAKFNPVDIDTIAAGGAKDLLGTGSGGVIKNTAKGLATEGAEEFLQSGQEQAFTNLGTGDPVYEGVGSSAVLGAATGAPLGAGVNLYSSMQESQVSKAMAEKTLADKQAEIELRTQVEEEQKAAGLQEQQRIVEQGRLRREAASSFTPKKEFTGALQAQITAQQEQDVLNPETDLGREFEAQLNEAEIFDDEGIQAAKVKYLKGYNKENNPAEQVEGEYLAALDAHVGNFGKAKEVVAQNPAVMDMDDEAFSAAAQQDPEVYRVVDTLRQAARNTANDETLGVETTPPPQVDAQTTAPEAPVEKPKRVTKAEDFRIRAKEALGDTWEVDYPELSAVAGDNKSMYAKKKGGVSKADKLLNDAVAEREAAQAPQIEAPAVDEPPVVETETAPAQEEKAVETPPVLEGMEAMAVSYTEEKLGPNWRKEQPQLVPLLEAGEYPGLQANVDRIAAEQTAATEVVEPEVEEPSTEVAKAEAATAVDNLFAQPLPPEVKLSKNEQAVFDTLNKAFQNNEQDQVIQANGSLNATRIAEMAGLNSKQAAQTAITRLRPKIARAYNLDQKQIKQRLADTRVKNVEAFDQNAPDQVFDQAELGNSSGTIASANQGAETDMRIEDIQFKDAIPEAPNRVVTAEQKAAIQQEIDTEIRADRGYKTAQETWDNGFESDVENEADRISFETLDAGTRFEWLDSSTEYNRGNMNLDDLGVIYDQLRAMYIKDNENAKLETTDEVGQIESGTDTQAAGQDDSQVRGEGGQAGNNQVEEDNQLTSQEFKDRAAKVEIKTKKKRKYTNTSEKPLGRDAVMGEFGVAGLNDTLPRPTRASLESGDLRGALTNLRDWSWDKRTSEVARKLADVVNDRVNLESARVATTKSKVKDIVYHGSPKTDITEFKGSDYTKGLYFSPSRGLAESYLSRRAKEQGGSKGRVYEVMLDIRKPLVIKGTSRKSLVDRIDLALGRKTERDVRKDQRAEANSSMMLSKERMADLKSQGYDGILNEDRSEYVVFSASQVHIVDSVFSGTQVEIVENLETSAGQPVAGLFSPETNTVKIDSDVGMTPHVLLHEVAHAATSATLADKAHPTTIELTELFESVRGSLGNEYGAKDVDEFVSEAMSNKKFQERLSEINPDGSKVSALQRFYNSVGNFLRKLIGMQPKGIDSAQTAADKLIDGILAPAPLSRDATEQALPPEQTPEEESKTAKALGKVMGGEAQAAQLAANVKQAYKTPLSALKPMSRTVRDAKEAMPSAGKFQEALYLQEQTVQEELLKIEEILLPTRDLSPTELAAMNEFISASTFYQKWGYEAEVDGKKVKVDPTMQRMFDKLAPAAQETAKNIFAYSETMREAMKKEAEDRGVKGVFKSSKLKGPYAALKRFGDYITVLKSQQVIDLQDELKQNPNDAKLEKRLDEIMTKEEHYIVKSFDTMGEAVKFKEQNKDRYAPGPGGASASAKEVGEFENRVTNPEAFAAVMGAIGADEKAGIDPTVKQNIQKIVEKLFYETLDEQNARLSGIKRKNRAGYEKDMVRSFVSHAQSQARLLSQLRHGADINQALRDMKQEARGNREELQQVANILQLKYNNMLTKDERSAAALQDSVTAFNSMYMLTTNVAYHVANATQPAISQAKIAGDFGNYSGSWGALNRGYKEAMGVIDSSLLKQLGTVTTVGMIDMGNTVQLNVENAKPEHQALLKKLQLRQMLDVGLEQDLNMETMFDTGYEILNKTSKGFKDMSHRLYQSSRYVEAYNRVAVAIAAYDMAVKNPAALKRMNMNPEEYAISIVEDTQGNYSNLDAPLVIDSLPKVTTQFRKFQLIMGWLWGTTARAALPFIGAETKHERAAARRTLAYLGLNVGSLAGVKGLPFVGMIGSAALMAFGDDGEEEPKDLERWMRENFEDEVLVDLLMRGAPSLIGIDLSAKLQQSDIFLPLNPQYIDSSPDAEVGKNVAFSLAFGPSAGTIGNIDRAYEQYSRGDISRAVEYLLPKGQRSALESLRFAQEGYSLKNGDVILDATKFDMYELVKNALGLTPLELSKVKWTYGQQIELKNYFEDEQSRLTREYKVAKRARDKATMGDLRAQWRDVQKQKDRTRYFFNDDINSIPRTPMSNMLLGDIKQRRREKKTRKRLGVD